MIDRFHGEYRFLSNFWPARVMLGGQEYPSVEHAYQAAKSHSPAEREAIRTTASPGEAKRMGQRLACRRADWEEVKIEIMRDLVSQKFSGGPLLDLLLDTGDQELIEGNDWGDTFWGVCRDRGENHLGKILVAIREERR
jgi:ribA/ribD-fused uncharacterized protein